MLAATARLASSAISATCSPGRTPRHVSTAFRAPGIKSVCGEPKFISTILLESAGFSIAGRLLTFLFLNWPMGQSSVEENFTYEFFQHSRIYSRMASRDAGFRLLNRESSQFDRSPEDALRHAHECS